MRLMQPCGSVIGVDVGCSPTRRSSAICRLDWSGDTISWEIARFRAAEPEREGIIAQIAGGHRVVAAAFDGPLRRGFDIIGRYRTAERMLTRRLQPLIGKPGQSSAPVGKLLNLHANECVRHVLHHADVEAARHGVPIDPRAVVEAFPSAFLGMMVDDPVRLAARRGDRSDTFFHHLAIGGGLRGLVEYLLPGRRLVMDPAGLVNHDDRAALVCALTALCVAADDFVAVGDADDGWIILPPRRIIQPAQWALLSLNGREETGEALRVFPAGAAANRAGGDTDLEGISTA
ncbi:hypothetical protein J2X65_004899 [Ancylobacter sp. 3268]|uniref:hypothetical protein n=1 Tax=Ancylobacter sp. 3268 TaxID=2817752 RepID=UPI00285E2ABB|nr:hypothetical protein [Ancylobacter sp. 3268]MDR6955519.1 hypothetical protein [Ancylobacter sp. 3268]